MMTRRAAVAAFVAVVTAFGLIASDVAAAVPVAKGPAIAKHTKDLKSSLEGISCASRSLCVGYGVNTAHDIDTITADGSKDHRHVSETTGAIAASCPSNAGCAVIEQPAPTYTDKVVLVSPSGAMSKPIGLGSAASTQLSTISCFPTRTHCTLVGGYGSQLYIVTLNGSTATGQTVTFPTSEQGVGIDSLSCPSASQCYAAGAVSVNNKERGLIVSIKNGTSAARTLVASASYNGLTSISCPSVTLCEAVGLARLHEFVYTLHSARISHTTQIPKGVEIYGIACETVHLCVMAGGKQQRVGNPKGALVPVRNGKIGRTQQTSVTTEYDGSRTEGTQVIAGFHGGVAAIGPDSKENPGTILSIS